MMVEGNRRESKQGESAPETLPPGESQEAVTRHPAQEPGSFPPADRDGLDDSYEGDDRDVTYWGPDDD